MPLSMTRPARTLAAARSCATFRIRAIPKSCRAPISRTAPTAAMSPCRKPAARSGAFPLPSRLPSARATKAPRATPSTRSARASSPFHPVTPWWHSTRRPRFGSMCWASFRSSPAACSSACSAMASSMRPSCGSWPRTWRSRDTTTVSTTGLTSWWGPSWGCSRAWLYICSTFKTRVLAASLSVAPATPSWGTFCSAALPLCSSLGRLCARTFGRRTVSRLRTWRPLSSCAVRRAANPTTSPSLPLRREHPSRARARRSRAKRTPPLAIRRQLH
mmetsp:Transcript_4407/g.12734  ORF Transcript_4407/g.12734 Transcript_4407/m.12734 type:complete len:274 (+) Transcript_4407:459-1280(+)